MQREERVMDASLDAILQRVVDIKGSLQELLVKTEREGEHGDWPSYLNSFSVISAQVWSHFLSPFTIFCSVVYFFLDVTLYLYAQKQSIFINYCFFFLYLHKFRFTPS